MRFLALIVFLWIACFSTTADSATCTMDPGAVSWGPIGTLTGDCVEGGSPGADDNVVAQDGTIVNIIDDITYDTDGSSLELQAGSKLTIDIPTLEQIVTIHFMDGQDGISVGGTSYDSVALWEEAGAEMDLQAAYLTYGLQTPLWQTEVATDNHTIWTVDQISPCDLADPNTSIASGIGGSGDCDTGTEKYGLSIVYSNPRNNPEDGNTGENYLHESINELTAKMLVCFTSGMDRNSCYSIGAIDGEADNYAISLRVMQLIQPDEAAIDYVAFPKAKRQQLLVDPMNAASKGDTCVDFDDTGTDWIAAKGDYVGACAYFYDSSGINGWPRPMPIARSLDDVDCDGAAGDDSVWFPEGIPFDLAANSKMVISPTCFGQGDKFYVMAAPVFEVEDGNGEWTLADGKILLEGTNTIRGTVIDSAGQVLCEGCSLNADDLRIFNTGGNGVAPLRFRNTADAQLSCSSIVGGPQTDDADGVTFYGVSGLTKLTDFSVRYCGGTAIASVTGSAMGPARFERVKIERAGKAVMSGTETIINVVESTWSDVLFRDLMISDPTSGTSDYILQSVGVRTDVQGAAIRGQVQGGIVRASATDVIQLWNILADQIDTTIAAGKTWMGSFLRFAEIYNVTLSMGNNAGIMGTSTDTLIPILISNSVFSKMTTTSNVLVWGHGGAGVTLQDNLYYNIDSTNTDCTDGTGCAMVNLSATYNNTVSPVIEKQTWAWDQSTSWTKAFNTNDVASYAVGIDFGGNAVINMLNDANGVDLYGFDVDAEIAASAQYRPGRESNCVTSVEVTGGASPTATYVSNFASFPNPKPILGTAADFEEGTFFFQKDSTLAREGCGNSTGARKPGLTPGHELLWEYMGKTIPQRRPLAKTNGRAY